MRNLDLPAGVNARDLGGLLGRDGRSVLRGRLYRSSEMTMQPAALDDSLAGLGLGCIWDLRTDKERGTHAVMLPQGFGAELCFRAHEHDDDNLHSLVKIAALDRDRRQAMRELYSYMLAEQAPSYREIFARISSGMLPMMYFCAAGKDRTGVLTALIYESLGVSRVDIASDYEETNRFKADFVEHWGLELADLDQEALDVLLAADGEYLDAMWASLDADYGGIESYLIDVLTMPRDIMQRLAHNLLASS